MPNDTATSPDDAQPAVPAAKDRAGGDRPRGRATGRNYAAARHYSPDERMALIYQAIRDGVSATSDRNDVPRSTLTTWLEEFGGISAIRAYLQEQVLAEYLRAERAVYQEVERRLPKMPNDELARTFRKLIEARTGMLAAQNQDGQPPALAAAKATVELRITEEADGSVKVIDLGPPPEDLE